MLIEGAFLKLPELLLSNFDHGSEVERTIVHLLGSALQMEMNARNIPRPFASVLAEKPYEGVPSDLRPVRADLYVDLESAVHFDSRMLAYGVRPRNWIEAKSALSTGRRATVTLRARALRDDLFRLCLLPKECPGASTSMDNGRYALWLLDADARNHLPSESWVRDALDPGRHTMQLEWGEKTRLLLEATVYTLSFEPNISGAPLPLFWGYLLRVARFGVSDGTRSFVMEGVQGVATSSEAVEALGVLRGVFLRDTEAEALDNDDVQPER